MNDMKIFENSEFSAVRVVDVNGEPWFVASDIAKALGYERPNDAVNTHCKKVNKFSYGDMPQGAQPYNIIPESDVMAKCTESFTAPNFGLSEYTDSTGRKLPLYLLSEDTALC